MMRDWSIRHSIASARHLVREATAHGASLETCLAGTGIDAAMIERVDAEITAEQELRLIRNVVTALPDATGLALQVGQHYRLTDFGIWGYALLSSRSLRDALQLALRFLDLSYVFGELAFEDHGDEIHLRFDYEMIPADIRQFLIERDVAAIAAVHQQARPSARSLRRLQFSFPRPAHANQLQILTGIVPQYDAAATVAVLDANVLDEPLSQANTATRKMCEAACAELLAKRKARAGVSAKVRDIMLRRPGAVPDMEAVAEELCITARTLRRHLAGEGSSFRILREEVLLMLAEELLVTAGMKMDQVAERLGYSDSIAFNHAFKRWKGVAPSALRRS
jgi:AraC-like DNA-binding protein